LQAELISAAQVKARRHAIAAARDAGRFVIISSIGDLLSSENL